MLATAAAATIATLADAALIQRSRSYFTGGFLAADAATGPGDAAGFVLASLLADAGVLSLLIALMLWAAARLGVPQWPGTVLATALALVPVAVADFASYELASYLGDAFDFSLMFDLAGRSPSEIIAVVWSHLWVVVWLLAGAAIGLIALIWFVRWCRRGDRPWPDRPGLLPALAVPVALCLIAMAVTTAVRRGSDVLDNGIRRKPTGQILGAVVNVLSDVDRDGYGVLGRPPDADLFDSRVRPYALDVPGDGVDEDAVGGDLSAGLPPYTEPSGTVPAFVSKPDVVLIVLESFRADAVGATIDGKPVTPVLDELARRGIAARRAYSHNGYTVQARRHIFTGSIADIRGGTTLIDDFKANGYETAYFSGQDESFGGVENGVGFERADVHVDARSDRDLRYSSFSTAGSLAVPNTVVLKRVTDFLRGRRHDKPLFLYVNFHDTHFPYHHRAIDPIVSSVVLPQDEIAPRNAAPLRAMYLNTAANVDRAIGRVLDEVRRAQGRDPGVVVLSDHGESLFDEGFLGHGYALNEAQTRIPFIVANLPVEVQEPLGQAELRDMLWRALTRHDGAVSPTLVLDQSRSVFQYLGLLPRAAAIAFTGSDHQLIYDFRDRRVRLDRGSWEAPDALPAARRKDWLELVTSWERMMLSRDKSAVLSRKRSL
jgi:glucan phosphoethanolaminetransferase (alkaline phosphatase superfamily)